jgi:hypothetical protein
MASPVRISDKLIGEVVGNISGLYKYYTDDIDKQKPDVGDRIYELLYGPYLSRMEDLPETFFHKIDRIEVKDVAGGNLGCVFKLSSTRLGSLTHPPGDNVGSSDTRFDAVNIKRTPYTEEIVDAILGWHRQKQDILEVRINSTLAVKRVMREHKSLAPAIKAFPPLVDLLPAATRLKVEVPQHRLMSALMELDPHLKRLASDIALKKMLNL